MAVAYVTSSSAVDGTGAATSITAPDVDASSANSCAIAFVSYRNNAAQTITGVTAEGAAMTIVGSQVDDGGGSIAAYRIIGISSAALTVVASFSAAPSNCQIAVLIFSGVDQTTPVGTHQTSEGNGVDGSATATAALTSAADGICVDGLFCRSGPTGITADGGQTERESESSSGSMHLRSSTEAGAASVTMGWTWTGSVRWGHIAIPLIAAGGSNFVPNIFHHFMKSKQ